MNLKKAISYVAFGYLIILVNINVTLSGTKVNISPDCVGWLLFFLAFDWFGSYTEGKKGMKAGFLLLAILSAALWVYTIAKPELAAEKVLSPVISLGSVILMFLLFGVLERVAHDHAPHREGRIRTLKYVNLFLYLIISISAGGFAGATVFGGISGPLRSLLAVAALAAMFAALAAAVVTAAVLFRLRGDFNDAQT